MANVTITTDPPTMTVTYEAADLASNVTSVTLWRTADGRTTKVRPPAGTSTPVAGEFFAAGGFIVTDAEAPFGIPVVYTAEQFDATGASLGNAVALTSQIDGIPQWTGYISDPLDDTTGVAVVMTASAGVTPGRTISGTVYQVGGQMVALTGWQTGVTAADMSFYTESNDHDAQVQALLAQSNGLVLIRTGPTFGAQIPRALYAFAGAANPTYMNGEGSTWTNSVTEVTPSTQPRVNTSAAWQVYINAFATWADFSAAFVTWLDAEKNPPSS